MFSEVSGPGDHGSAWKRRIRSGSVGLMTWLWAAYLIFPLTFLKPFQIIVFRTSLPIYYLATVPPALAAFACAVLLKTRWSRTELLWCAFPLIAIIGIASSGDRLWSLREWTSWIARGYALGCVFFLVGGGGVFFKRILRRVYPLAAAAILLGLLELFTGFNPFARLFGINLAWISPIGTQGNRIAFTACIVPFVPIILWRARTENSYGLLHVLLAISGFVLVALAHSRTGWVGLFVAISAYLFLSRQDKRFLRLCGGIALGVMVVGASIPASRTNVLDRLRMFRKDDIDIQHRLGSYSTVRALVGRWAFGVGYGQYPRIYRPYYRGPAEDYPSLATPDNQYLRWLIETGVAGLAALIVFFGVNVAAGWRGMQSMGSLERGFYEALLCGWLGVASTFFFFDGFYWGGCNMTFWAFFSMFVACIKEPAAES